MLTSPCQEEGFDKGGLHAGATIRNPNDSMATTDYGEQARARLALRRHCSKCYRCHLRGFDRVPRYRTVGARVTLIFASACVRPAKTFGRAFLHRAVVFGREGGRRA
jgi:hypothetical protein